MAEAWPSSLQQLLSEANFGINSGSTVIRSENDIGRPKVRRRFTKAFDIFTASIYLTVAQYTTFKNFYDTTLNGGVLSFNFNHPITGVASEFEFASDPVYASIGGGNFTVQFQWRELP